MTKSELNQIAKETLVMALARAYYSLEDDKTFDNLSDEEKDYIYKQVDKHGKTMCKAIGKKYFTL